jgi:DNA ligase-1
MARIRRRAYLLLLVLSLVLPCRAADGPALMLATRWQEGLDPTGWWMSEKYDGVRGYWDGARMLTRQGAPIAIPAALRKELPDFSLDGELWAGRGRFQQTVATVRDAVPGPGWSSVRYLVFDAPAHPGAFETRLARIEAWLREHPSAHVRVVEQVRCSGRPHLRHFLAQVERQGGEGVMLRAAGSPYTAGRSDHLRKFKSFDDAEAVVRGYNSGRGKYEGMVGSLIVELPDGMRFSVGSGLSDEQRRAPPPVGSTITFKHHGWTDAGKPRFPVFWRVREAPLSRLDES